MLLALSSNQKLAIALVAAAFVGFALLSAVVIPRSNPDFPERRLNLFLGVAVAFTVAMLLTIAFVAKETGEEEHAAATETQATTTTAETTATETTTAETTATETTATETTAPAGNAAAGKVVFTSTCAGCHTLSDAGSDGPVGPNLDASQPTYDLVVDRATNGKGVMPAFGDDGDLTETQIQDVAAYVSSVAGS